MALTRLDLLAVVVAAGCGSAGHLALQSLRAPSPPTVVRLPEVVVPLVVTTLDRQVITFAPIPWQDGAGHVRIRFIP
ncbi:MAG: hypothetical protein R3E10_01050 [Gemmatimonadota bacterium]